MRLGKQFQLPVLLVGAGLAVVGIRFLTGPDSTLLGRSAASESASTEARPTLGTPAEASGLPAFARAPIRPHSAPRAKPGEPAEHIGSVGNSAGSGPRAPRFDPTPLDRATPQIVREALDRAVETARAERPLAIAPGVLDAAAQADSIRVVFGAPASHDASDLAAILDPGQGSATVEDLRVFPLLGQGAALLSPSALHRLITDTPTPSIELDAAHSASLLTSVPQIGGDAAHGDGHDGDDFAVAVLDTGVDVGHPMFAGRVIEEACFSILGDCPNAQTQMLGAGAAAPCANPGCDHGTHVAGIALGDDDPGPVVGVAPRAELIAINVFSDDGGEALAYTSDILAAMQHVLALEVFHDVAAINLSLGGQPHTSNLACAQASPSFLAAVNQLRAAGILTVAASGNEEFTNAISSPGCLANVISVGSVGDGDVVSDFSNSATFLSLLAPGETIQSAAAGGGLRNASGTSMATPHVAGAIAAIREAVPTATVDEIEDALSLSGDPITDGRNGITRPRVQLDAAIALLQAAPANPGGGGGPVAENAAGAGGGGCGLVGLEPFLVLPLVRFGRRRFRAMGR